MITCFIGIDAHTTNYTLSTAIDGEDKPFNTCKYAPPYTLTSVKEGASCFLYRCVQQHEQFVSMYVLHNIHRRMGSDSSYPTFWRWLSAFMAILVVYCLKGTVTDSEQKLTDTKGRRDDRDV